MSSSSGDRNGGSNDSAPHPSRTRRRLRRLAILSSLGLAGYFADRELNASALARTARVGFYASLILADFKLNFSDKSTPEQIDAIHSRVAERLNYVCVENGGQSTAVRLRSLLPRGDTDTA